MSAVQPFDRVRFTFSESDWAWAEKEDGALGRYIDVSSVRQMDQRKATVLTAPEQFSVLQVKFERVFIRFDHWWGWHYDSEFAAYAEQGECEFTEMPAPTSSLTKLTGAEVLPEPGPGSQTMQERLSMQILDKLNVPYFSPQELITLTKEED